MEGFNTMLGYREIGIFSPSMVVEGGLIMSEIDKLAKQVCKPGLTKPELSPDFTMEDIWKLKEYNSLRWSEMTYEELKAELDESSRIVQNEINAIREARLAAVN